MRVAFSGTRDGLTGHQRKSLAAVLGELRPSLVRQGCCVGADEQAAVMANALSPRPTVFGHPSTLKGMTSETAVALCDDTAYPEPPLDRNRSMVKGADVLVACPKAASEEKRSGTWATIRAARKGGLRVIIIHPDGTTAEDGFLPSCGHCGGNGAVCSGCGGRWGACSCGLDSDVTEASECPRCGGTGEAKGG